MRPLSAARRRDTVDTHSREWEVCLHEVGHLVVARELGWTNHEIRMRHTWLGGWEGGYQGDWPQRLNADQLALQRAAVALGGPEVSRRRSWLFLPAGCGWDIDHAKDVLADSRISYARARSLARQLVGKHWVEIERDARTLYLANGVWPS
jgi:hypothetical protein